MILIKTRTEALAKLLRFARMILSDPSPDEWEKARKEASEIIFEYGGAE